MDQDTNNKESFSRIRAHPYNTQKRRKQRNSNHQFDYMVCSVFSHSLSLSLSRASIVKCCVCIYLDRQTSVCGRTLAWKIKLNFCVLYNVYSIYGPIFCTYISIQMRCVKFHSVLFYRRDNFTYMYHRMAITIAITTILIDNEVFLRLTHLSHLSTTMAVTPPPLQQRWVWPDRVLDTVALCIIYSLTALQQPLTRFSL